MLVKIEEQINKINDVNSCNFTQSTNAPGILLDEIYTTTQIAITRYQN